MESKSRDEKMEKILSTIDGFRKKEASFKKISESFKSLSESEFKSLAKLCPGRKNRSDRENEFTMRGMYDHWKNWDCDCGPLFCEYEECPLVKGQRFKWEDDDADN